MKGLTNLLFTGLTAGVIGFTSLLGIPDFSYAQNERFSDSIQLVQQSSEKKQKKKEKKKQRLLPSLEDKMSITGRSNDDEDSEKNETGEYNLGDTETAPQPLPEVQEEKPRKWNPVYPTGDYISQETAVAKKGNVRASMGIGFIPTFNDSIVSKVYGKDRYNLAFIPKFSIGVYLSENFKAEGRFTYFNLGVGNDPYSSHKWSSELTVTEFSMIGSFTKRVNRGVFYIGAGPAFANANEKVSGVLDSEGESYSGSDDDSGMGFILSGGFGGQGMYIGFTYDSVKMNDWGVDIGTFHWDFGACYEFE